MSATSILKARAQIEQLNKSDMKELVEEALQMGTAEEVIEAVNKKCN